MPHRSPAIPAGVAHAFRRLIEQDARAGVALSAGADSTLALLETVDRLGPHRVVALHYDHGLRGADSDADAQAAAELATRLGVEFHCERRPLGLPADEATLRDDRIGFLNRMAREHRLAAIITGHHADDVAETLLMRIARGAGTSGLAAPRPVAGHADGLLYLRPLLHHKKQEILNILRSRGHRWREDAGNADPTVALRNAMRHEILPLWRAHCTHDVVRGAARTRTLLEEDAVALDEWAASAWRRLQIGERDENWCEDATMPRAILRRLLHRRLIAMRMHNALSAPAFDTLLEHLVCGTPTVTSVRGAFLCFDGRQLTCRQTAAAAPREPAMLPIPGAIHWPDGATLTASLQPAPLQENASVSIHREAGAYAPLQARPAHPGERYRARTATTATKIRELLRERGIPPESRSSLPVIEDARGPVWIPGLPPADTPEKSGDPHGALQLTWTPPHAP